MPKTPYPLSSTLSQVINELVRDGDSVALEGFTHLIPFAAGHEIILAPALCTDFETPSRTGGRPSFVNARRKPNVHPLRS